MRWLRWTWLQRWAHAALRLFVCSFSFAVFTQVSAVPVRLFLTSFASLPSTQISYRLSYILPLNNPYRFLCIYFVWILDAIRFCYCFPVFAVISYTVNITQTRSVWIKNVNSRWDILKEFKDRPTRLTTWSTCSVTQCSQYRGVMGAIFT